MSGGFTPALRTTSYNVTAGPSILASEHAMFKRGGITVDAATVGADSDGNKILVAGTIMGEIAATGKYGAYDNAANDGRETAVGILPEGINLRYGDVITGLLIHGSVLTARLSGHDSSSAAAMAGRIIFQ